MRRMIVSWIGVSLLAGSAGVVAADAPPAADASVQLVAGGRVPGARGTARTPSVRRYRSYSIDPGPTTGVTEGAIIGGAVPAPRSVTPAPSTRQRSRPSYMRGESKALGRFHQ